jgi:signal transduction histidine kinase
MRDITERIDSLSELINDLMVYARPRPLTLGTVDLRALVEQAVAAIQRDPAAKRATVVIEGGSLQLRADSEMVRAALLNLLLNAAQSMEAGGRIGVSITAEHTRAVIAIRDSGTGITPELAQRVFEPFFTTKARGGGLGLPIARRTAERHGGSLTLAPAPGGGTVATLTLSLDEVG